MQSRILITLLLSVISFVGFSQAPPSYHRLYETALGFNMDIQEDTVFYHMSSATVSGNVTAMGTKRIADDNLSLIFTNHDGKGDIKWSREIDLGQDTVTILGVGEMDINQDKDSIIFTIDAEINGVAKQLFGRMTTGGQGLVLQTVGGNEFATLGKTPKLTNFFNQSNLLVTQGDRPTISRVGLGEELRWSRTYEFKDENGNNVEDAITDLKMTADSTFVVVGTHQNGSSIIASELDSFGVQIWAESYSFENLLTGAVEAAIPNEVYPLENGHFAIVGEAMLTFGDIKYGFVMVVDTAGVTQFSKLVVANENFQTEINSSLRNVIQSEDGMIWASGVYTENDTVRYFMTNMDGAGNQNWTTRYGAQTNDDDPFTTSVFNVNVTGGVTLVGHGEYEDVKLLSVMKHDIVPNEDGNGDGYARCSDTLSVMLQNVDIVEDTLVTEVVNGGLFFVDFEYEELPFSGFTPPTLNVEGNYMFCPNEIIDTVLIASVSRVPEEFVTYQWANEDGEIPGATNDSLFVDEEGQYSVYVTIDDVVCFIQCDTVELTRIAVPMASINAVDNSRCENGEIIFDFDLIASTQDGRSPYSYVWAGGEVTSIINITQPGTYSFTVTDDCGEPASQSITIEEPTFDPKVLLDENITEFCQDGTYSLVATYTGGGNIPSFTWSTGVVDSGVPVAGGAAFNSSIEISESGEYGVTVTDNCGFEVSVIKDFEVMILADEAEITFEVDCNEENIELSEVVISSTAVNGAEVLLETQIIDEEGNATVASNDNPTENLGLGVFRIFATDFCGNLLDSMTINTTSSCGGFVQYPTVFFPSGNEDSERVFGPIPSDTMDLDRISDVEFKVFNRWGETVFETTDIEVAWDGTHKGDPAPSEVYIWYVSYLLDGQEMLDKGDITLVR